MFKSFFARPIPRQNTTCCHVFVFLNRLTECDDTDHRHRYFDNESFGTKFKAFHNLGAEWHGWMQFKKNPGTIQKQFWILFKDFVDAPLLSIGTDFLSIYR